MQFNEASSKYWSSDPDMNAIFVRQVRNHVNDELRKRGHVFLNEVLDLLGMPRTRQGQLAGWRAGSYIELWEGDYPIASLDIPLKFNVENNILDAIEQ